MVGHVSGNSRHARRDNAGAEEIVNEDTKRMVERF